MGPEDQHPWDREEIRQAFAAKDAEIARLTEDLRITIAVCNENIDLKKLIIELCDALEGASQWSPHQVLIIRARETTR